MRLLVLDNFDSFTYNLVHLVEKCSDISCDVRRNNEISISEVNAYDKVLLSPGPGLPSEAGIMPELLKKYHATKSILGVCLGFQAIGECYSYKLKNLQTVYHGLATPIRITDPDPLFDDCPENFSVGRYHSWVIDPESGSGEMKVTAVDEKNLVMAARHKTDDVRGVQFHPESILSEFGETIIRNWLSLKKQK